IALLEQFSRDRLEQAPAHDLEALFRGRRPPGGLYAPDYITQAVERLTPTNAADLHVVDLGVRGAGGIGGRKRDNEQAVLCELGRFRQCLGERELSLEAPRGQIALIMELAR